MLCMWVGVRYVVRTYLWRGMWCLDCDDSGRLRWGVYVGGVGRVLGEW